jgi:hypothetical protein
MFDRGIDRQAITGTATKRQCDVWHPTCYKNPLKLADALMLTGEVLQGAGRRAASEPVLSEALALFEAALPGDHPDLVRTRALIESSRS